MCATLPRMKWTLALVASLAVLILLVVVVPMGGCGESPNGVEPSLTKTVGDPPVVSGGPASAKNPRNRPAPPAAAE